MSRDVQRIGAADRPIWRSSVGRVVSANDRIAIEAPLEIRIDGSPVVIVMRTPGHDEELARGLAFAEGWYDDPSAQVGLTRPTDDTLSKDERGNVVCLDLPPGGRPPAARTLLSKSSCGVCGKTAISDIDTRAQPLTSGSPISAARLAGMPAKLRERQPLFDATGGVHAAALFRYDGELLCAREDVGRHNAVDKVVGHALASGWLPELEAVLCVSGRASFEIVQKALMARIAIVVAVSAPSSLAVDIAERFRMTLCGFARGGDFNIYTHSARIAPDE